VQGVTVEFGLWRIDGGLRPVDFVPLIDERRIEDAAEADPKFLGLDVMIIGRQVITEFGTRLDLLAVDADGDLVAIELKRDRTPRDVIAQVLDYGSWLVGLGYDDIVSLYRTYRPDAEFESDFEERFGVSPPEALNTDHHLVVVASRLDAASERIVRYLSDRFGVPVNVVFFRHFRDGDAEYLARTWLITPSEADSRPASKTVRGKREDWNGTDYYVSLGEGPARTWEDCRRYGFISGGGGLWYSNTLKMLSPGDRVFACVPGKGYVGVGEVTGTRTPIADAVVDRQGEQRRLLDLPFNAPNPGVASDSPELSEYIVPVMWIGTRGIADAVWTKGLFANQNTVCKLRNRFTLTHLYDAFGVEPK
jgi:hypothetical protein